MLKFKPSLSINTNEPSNYNNFVNIDENHKEIINILHTTTLSISSLEDLGRQLGPIHTRDFALGCRMTSKIYKKDNKIYKTFWVQDINSISNCINKIALEIVNQKHVYKVVKSNNYDIIIPKIYSYGKINYENTSDTIYFIEMDYIIGRPYNENETEIINDKLDWLLQQQKICHNDDKPENIFITPDDKVAIIDWGEANMNCNKIYSTLFRGDWNNLPPQGGYKQISKSKSKKNRKSKKNKKSKKNRKSKK